MVEKGAVASARLELLSNTAMLKRVLDRKMEISRGTPEPKKYPEDDLPARIIRPTPSMVSVQSPTPPMAKSECSQRGESPSPQTIMESSSSRDAPPNSNDRSMYTPSASYLYHYNRIDIDTARDPKIQLGCPPYSALCGGPPGYLHPPNGEVYFPDHRNLAAVSMSQVPHHPYHGLVRGSYKAKDSLSTRAYRESGIYKDIPPVSDHGSRASVVIPSARSTHISVPVTSEDVDESRQAAFETLMRENFQLHEQMKEKDEVVSTLQQRVNYLEKQINELRQLPTGKISHIPIDDMIRIMQEYGSEVSNQTLPKRKDNIKKASIVRQFRRWNPEFFRYFIHVNGEWVPKLGKEGELKRRAEKRRIFKKTQEKSS